MKHTLKTDPSPATPSKKVKLSMDTYKTAILDSDIIELLISKEGSTKPLRVHRALLCQVSTKLKDLVSADFKDPPSSSQPSTTNNDTKTFSKCDGDALEVFVVWLYRRDLPYINHEDEDLMKQEIKTYILLYFLATEWEIPALRNAIIDRLRTRSAFGDRWFPDKMMGEIYTNTGVESQLRAFLVDAWLYESLGLDEGTRRQRLIWMMGQSGEFVADVYKGMLGVCAKSKIKEPGRRGGCVYHEHEVGGREVCYLEG